MMGSGPSAKRLFSATLVSRTQPSGRKFHQINHLTRTGIFSLRQALKLKPLRRARHTTAKPLARDCARAESSKAASRCASRSKRSCRSIRNRKHHSRTGNSDDGHHHHQLHQRESVACDVALYAYISAYCQEPISAFLPSPPATPSAPKLITSTSF